MTSDPENNPVQEGDDLYGLGYDLYPERRQARPYTFTNFFFKHQGREEMEQFKCEKRIAEVVRRSKNCHYLMIRTK